ncbi:bifunctional diguanylate cyclase/phosphodiesterase [Oceanobacillus sp. J11TS1]|uniref:putative bifunctional diguanylate cyclase/phosphodiesterase n=1 Tax=Oceanobacillus sp. J11TS1 TaxID=2807191 RepID=UPI001B07D589|nr:GGDEF domain-containing phosphodiesterase [Oceanobacillus sp. J11TS1]GIO24207.1 GGDEF domain-containing protein [Oceanobacillus sp. J11TS1]
MNQVEFKIKNEKIYFKEQLSDDVLNEPIASISGKNYEYALSSYVSPYVAKKFSQLVTGKQEQLHFHTTFETKEGETLVFRISGQRFESEDGAEISGEISDMKQSDEQLTLALKELSDMKYALDQSVILAITNRQGKITHANDHFCDVSGYSRDELIGNTHQLINSGYHSRAFFKNMWRTIGQGNVWKGEIRNRAKDGSLYWVDTTIVPMINEKGEPTQYIAIRFDITDKKENEEKIRHMAYFDYVTGLANRRKFDEYLKRRTEIAGKNKEKFGIMFIDLDGFNYLNDTLGYLIGDQLLIEAARRFKKIVGDRGMIARIGEDEFVIVIDSITDAEEMQVFAASMMADFKDPFFVGGYELNLTGSIGIATYPEAGRDAATITKHAALAMYRVKGSSKNDYRFFDSDMKFSNHRSFQIKNDLRKGLDQDQFYIVYQPKVSPKDDSVTSVEALIRWKHQEFGELSPFEFIPLAEEIGMINEIGDWVIQAVCKQLQSWALEGYHPIPVSVNVSARQFLQANFVETFFSHLDTYQIDPSWIQMEITESLFIDNVKYVQQILEKIKAKGIKIALDDFGTGYSSLAYLRKLDLDILKIDRSLISGINDTSNQKEIAITIIRLGKSLGMEVVAEGVETEEELDILRNHGIDEIQGYYYSKPLGVSDMHPILKTKRLD